VVSSGLLHATDDFIALAQQFTQAKSDTVAAVLALGGPTALVDTATAPPITSGAASAEDALGSPEYTLLRDLAAHVLWPSYSSIVCV
jgi:hypothetical protein